MRKNTIDVITLGCSKNLVDSEKLMRQLEANGYKVTHDTDRPQGEIAVINTCGFIGDAKEESINMILEFCQAKEEGRLKKLFVMGCLSERYLKELGEEIPQVDKFYGKFDWNELLTDLGKAYHQELSLERELTTPSHYAYLKISEGCDRRCSYCAIPIITGKHVSRPIEDILDEVRMLVSRGVKEFQVIAQELTYYGLDLYHRQMLPELIERMADIPGVDWIRLHYAYPANFPVDLFRVMREKKNVCKFSETLNTGTQTFPTKHIICFIKNSNKFFAVILNFRAYGIYFIGRQITQSKCFADKFVYFLAIENGRSICHSMKCFAENAVSSKYKRGLNSFCILDALFQC